MGENNVAKMSELELKSAIKKIVETNLGGKSISDTDHFDKDLKVDSVMKMELLMEFEDAFGIEISDADAVKLVSVNDIAEYIKGLN